MVTIVPPFATNSCSARTPSSPMPPRYSGRTLDADVVLHMPLPSLVHGDDPGADLDNFCRLLASGKHVITTVGYMYPKVYGDEVMGRLTEACELGGVTFHDARGVPVIPRSRKAGAVLGYLALTERLQELVAARVQAARLYAKAGAASILYAMGITQHTTGVANVMSCANLQMLLGNMGVPGGGVNPLRGQNNVQGACDMGGLPNVYPAYQQVVNDEVRLKFETAWGTPLSPTLGKTVTEMIPSIPEGKIKALYILGENPVMSDPDSNHIRHCLEQLDFMVLQEIFPSETSHFADVMLPGVTFAEKDGTFTNTERRVQMVRQAIPAIGDARMDWEITSEIANRVLELGSRKIDKNAPYGGWKYTSPEQIMAEVASVAPSYAGVTYDRLNNGEQLQWPIKSQEHAGTPILHVGQFTRGKGLFAVTEHIPPFELPDKEYPVLLSTGRVLYHWHGGEMTRRAKGLMEVYGESLIEVNPEDAQKLGINGNRRVRVTSRRGSIEAEAWVTDRVPSGMVYANFHFPEVPANELTVAALDPIAKIPEYKVCAVKVELA